jgi:hypothetical protein
VGDFIMARRYSSVGRPALISRQKEGLAVSCGLSILMRYMAILFVILKTCIVKLKKSNFYLKKVLTNI